MRVYLRDEYCPPYSTLIVGTRHISVCDDFARWFRRKFGEEADLQDVWKAMIYPAWMLWVTTRPSVPRILRELMQNCLDQIRRTEPFSLGEAVRHPALARKIRLVMPAELLEALLSESDATSKS